MTVTLDTDRVDAVAETLERQRDRMTSFAVYLREMGQRMHLTIETRGGAALCDEAADEIGATIDILRARVELATIADEWAVGFEPAEAAYAAAVRRLTASLDDDVGGLGDGDDALRLVAGDVLGHRVDDPRHPVTITRVLDEADAREAGRFWLLLGLDGQDVAIDHATAAVSDRFLAGDIHLDATQIVALRSQPLPAAGRGPSSGGGTDWAGTPVPDEERVVWAYDRELEPFADGVVCSLVQAVSPIPAPLSTGPVGFTIEAASTAKQLRDLARTQSIVIPSTSARSVPLLSLFAGLVDLGLCRLGVGSGYPIDTSRTVTEAGETVYAGSRSPSQPYMDRNGLPLDPDPRTRDEQMWRAQHNVENGSWAPYPGFPAYEVNATGYGG